MSHREQAIELLERTPLIDGHNDLPITLRELWNSDLDAIDLSVVQPDLSTDIPRLREGRVRGQFWSVYMPSDLRPHEAVTGTLEQIDLVRRVVDRYSDDLTLCTTAKEARVAASEGKIASLLGMEGGHQIEESLGALRMFRSLGVRYMTLTHWDDTSWASSATDTGVSGGLTDFGAAVVREMNDIGMIVDLSHVSSETMRRTLDISRAPVMFSHSCCQALVDHPRNVPDDVLSRLPVNGGVIMLSFMPYFVSSDRARWQRSNDPDEAERVGPLFPDEDPAQLADFPRPVVTIQQVADHIEHARRVAGIDYIGIGSDFYDATDGSFPEGLQDVSGFPDLFAELLYRGWSDEHLEKLAGRNILRVLESADQ